MTLPLLAAVLLAAGPPTRVAVVVGNNHALPGSGYDTLSYADDDAVRYAELFESVGVGTTLVTAPDRDTAERHPELAARALRPTRTGLLEVLDGIEQRLRAAPAPRELYFVFSGHGSLTASEAYLHLFDGRFSRTDLFEHVLRRMPAERVHVVIDSCHAYFLVNARGERVAVAEEEEDLARYPHVGFLLSTSDRREVQEWSGYRAGVFSYQLAGALRGAADVDLDGLVTYAEVHAYVVAANYAVTNASARIRPYVRRPARDVPLIDLRAVPDARKARVDAELGGHFHLVDEERGRLLDANKPQGTALSVVVPSRPLLMRHGDGSYGLVREASQAGRFVARPDDSTSKGTVADEFREHLFAVPLSPDFVRGVEAGSPQVTSVKTIGEAPVAWYGDPLTLSLLGVGLAGVVAGGFSTVLWDGARDEADRRPITAESPDARARAHRWQVGMVTGYAAGGSLLLAGILRAMLTNVAPVSPTAQPGGVGVGGRF